MLVEDEFSSGFAYSSPQVLLRYRCVASPSERSWSGRTGNLSETYSLENQAGGVRISVFLLKIAAV